MSKEFDEFMERVLDPLLPSEYLTDEDVEEFQKRHRERNPWMYEDPDNSD